MKNPWGTSYGGMGRGGIIKKSVKNPEITTFHHIFSICCAYKAYISYSFVGYS